MPKIIRYVFKYSPDQPRVPAGNPDGGQWTDEDSSGAAASASKPSWYQRNKRWVKPVAIGIGATGAAILTLGAAVPEEIAGAALLEGGAEGGSALLGGGAEGAAASEAAEVTAPEWKLGDFKSDTTWANQMASRGWTQSEITEAIQSGEQFPAPNFVNPANSATRYVSPSTGRYLVKDDVTNEILQLAGDNFDPPPIPKK